jgi:hypothetical protein
LSIDWHLEETFVQQDNQHQKAPTSFPKHFMEEFVHFENFFQNHRVYKKKIASDRAGKSRNSECRGSKHKNEGASRALRVSETAIILYYQF